MLKSYRDDGDCTRTGVLKLWYICLLLVQFLYIYIYIYVKKKINKKIKINVKLHAF
jgi:hypothetical protein